MFSNSAIIQTPPFASQPSLSPPLALLDPPHDPPFAPLGLHSNNSLCHTSTSNSTVISRLLFSHRHFCLRARVLRLSSLCLTLTHFCLRLFFSLLPVCLVASNAPSTLAVSNLHSELFATRSSLPSHADKVFEPLSDFFTLLPSG